MQNLRDQAPTDLEPSRIDALNKSTEMVKYAGQERISKNNVNNYIQDHPEEAENVAKLYEVPGATDEDIENYFCSFRALLLRRFLPARYGRHGGR